MLYGKLNIQQKPNCKSCQALEPPPCMKSVYKSSETMCALSLLHNLVSILLSCNYFSCFNTWLVSE